MIIGARRKPDKRQNEEGAIIIEGVLYLSLFLFLFMMFYSVVDICNKEAKINHALCGAAKDISEYSYIYAFSGLKYTMENVAEDAEKTKSDIKTNVIDNFEGVMDGLSSLGSNASIGSSNPDFSQGLSGFLDEDTKKSTDMVKEKGTALFNYIKKNLGSPKNAKAFLGNLLKMLASDGYEILKKMIGQILAKSFCEKYMLTESEQKFLETVDFSKSMLFPGESDEIILVAEYKVKIIPFIPVDIEYVMSQQVITKGWLYGDRNNFTSAKSNKKTNKPKKNENGKKQENQKKDIDEKVWSKYDDENMLTKYLKRVEESELESQGYYMINNDKGQKMYNENNNEVLYVESSNPLIGCESVDDFDKEASQKRMIQIINNLNTAENSEISIQKIETNGNSKIETINLAEKGEVKKKIIMVVPKDEGLEAQLEDAWNSIPEDERAGIEIEIVPQYGTYIENADNKKEGE